MTVLITRIRDHITHWNANAKPFVWTATTEEVLAKLRRTQTNIKRPVDNNVS